jgi:type I restriction enzyme S subunit
MTNIPYKLPDGWKWVKLDEVCIINPRRPRILREPNKPTTFIPMSAVYDETGTITAAEVRPFKQVSKGYTYFEENDILFAKITPCMENGKAAIARGLIERIGFGSTEFHVLRPKPIVLPEWVWLFVRRERFREDAKKFFRGGVGQQRVPQEFLEQYLIPLPPLEEQKRIVARIEELRTRIKEAKKLRQESKEKTELLWQSALAETFPKPGTQLPDGWKWVKLSEVAWRDSVILRPSDNPKFVVRYLGMEHVSPGQWDEPTPVELLGEEVRSQVIMYRPGLVLYGRLRPYLNKVVVPSSEGVASTEFVPIAVNKDVLSPHYLGAYLRSPWFVTYATQNTTGSRQPRVRFDALWNAPVPLPPLEEQKRIVAHLQALQEKIKSLKESQTHTETKLKELENSILDKAFKGEL